MGSSQRTTTQRLLSLDPGPIPRPVHVTRSVDIFCLPLLRSNIAGIICDAPVMPVVPNDVKQKLESHTIPPSREEDRRTPYALVTFGGGPRLCIGVHFATIEVKVLAAHVLRSYRLEPINNKPPAQIGLFATVIPDGIPMRVLARSRAVYSAA